MQFYALEDHDPEPPLTWRKRRPINLFPMLSLFKDISRMMI
jgi:hypothetical protein